MVDYSDAYVGSGAAAGGVAGAGSAAITDIGEMPMVTEIRVARLRRAIREIIKFSKRFCRSFDHTHKVAMKVSF
jgi:hypothetical protein